MKFRITALIGAATVIMCVASASQRNQHVAKESASSYPIAGSHLLHRDDAMVREYFRKHPEALHPSPLQKGSAWGFTVGSTHTWTSINFTTNVFFDVPSTCRAVGTHCYIFVEDASWGSKVTQAVIDSVEKAFDTATPADPNKGIYEMDVDAFGNPPDVDSDPRIIILIMDIQDGYNGSGGYVAGYFHSVNELPTKGAGSDPNSNHAEIYYLDCNPANLTSEGGLVEGMSTTAHEFQHMIHFNYDQNEMTFINEGCSLVAEVNAGYSLYDQSGYTSEPNHYLFDWRNNDNTAVLRDYSRAARFMVYMRDQFTMGFFKPLVQSTSIGVSGINAALTSIGSSLTFNTVLGDWLIANAVNSSAVDTAYKYKYPVITKVTGDAYFNPNVDTTTRTVQGYAADYISFVNGSDLTASLTLPDQSPLTMKVVTTGSGGTTIGDVTSGTPYHFPEFGNTISTVTFIVMNTTTTSSQQYTLLASGISSSVEMKYDQTEPVGYLPGDPNDTVCVVFNAVSNGTLDSVRVAIRRAGSMKGGVWQYSGKRGGSPLGTPLVTNISAQVTETPSVPYPVPWPNWGVVDLSSQNISTSSSFAVAFVNEGQDGSTMPRVMVTESPIPSQISSLTYVADANPGWFYIPSNSAGDSVFTYLIRAYVSVSNPAGVKQTVELTPREFSLSQNFPNPFNPSTKIRYVLPSQSYVSLKVYDLLGKEIATLVDGVQSAGEQSIDFTAYNIPSGIYFYTLRAGNFIETKKMIVLK